MKYILTTIAGVEALAKKEIEKCDGKIEEVTDRLVTFSGGVELIPRVNLWSRVGNKLYILLEEKENVTDFDSLFDLISNVSWKKYFKSNNPILIKSSSTRSELFSEKTIQSIGKKAVIKSLVGEGEYYENANQDKLEILVLLIDNKARIMLNTSGNALHMRGYRKETGDAPIKESLAAALVLLSNWRFKENFYDPFCGSGTIAIEALMIARNIAPGLKRNFAFERLGIVNSEVTENERLLAKKKEYSGEYSIIATDIDKNMIEIAKENVKRAGFEGEIKFEVKDFREYINTEMKGTLVSNPPYGDRLKDDDLKNLYVNIDKLFRQNKELNGGIISSYMEFDEIIKKDMYKKRKLYNGGVMCYFWKKIL